MNSTEKISQPLQYLVWTGSTLASATAIYALCQTSSFVSALHRLHLRDWHVTLLAGGAVAVAGVSYSCHKTSSTERNEDSARITDKQLTSLTIYDHKLEIQGAQQGSNPGGKTTINGIRYYAKLPSIKKDRDTKKLWDEWLASQLYRLCGVPFPEVQIAQFTNQKLCFLSKWMDGWQSLQSLQRVPDDCTEFYENFAIDAWMDAYDVLGLDGDNIGFIKQDNDSICYRLDAGGTFNNRASANESKRHSIGEDAFSNEALSLKSILERPCNHRLQAMTCSQFYIGAEKLASVDDEAVRELIMSMGIRNEVEKAQFAEQMIERKQFVVGYAQWLKMNADNSNEKFYEIVKDGNYSLEKFRQHFKATGDPHSPL